MEVAYSWIIYSFVIFGPSVLCDRKLERRQTESSCSGNTDDSYHCSKNVCIDWMSVCDGYVDCSDGSDEDDDMCGRYDYETNMAMDCGKVRTNNQVISKKGSMEALVSTAPWYVRIFRFSSRMNGGIIIAPNVVITVASDIYYHEIILKSKKSTKISVTNISEYSVNVGRGGIEFMTGDKIKNIEFHQKINVETIYLREGYKEYGSEDIAILVLVDKIPFRDGLAAPVCIDWRNKYGVFNGDQGKVVVYNQTSSKDNDGEYTYFEKNTSYLNSITCAKHYPDMCGPVTSYEQFCALRKMGNKNFNSDLSDQCIGSLVIPVFVCVLTHFKVIQML